MSISGLEKGLQGNKRPEVLGASLGSSQMYLLIVSSGEEEAWGRTVYFVTRKLKSQMSTKLQAQLDSRMGQSSHGSCNAGHL